MKYSIASLIGHSSSVADRLANYGIAISLFSPLTIVIGVVIGMALPQATIGGLITLVWLGSWGVGGLLSAAALSEAARSKHPDDVRKKGYIGLGITIAHLIVAFAAFWLFLATLFPQDWWKALLGAR